MKMIGTYQQEHLETLQAVRRYLEPFLDQLPDTVKRELKRYEAFRLSVDRFLDNNLNEICTSRCFSSQKSACCSKEGIIAVFADMVVNVLNSTPLQLDRMEAALKEPNPGSKCVYLEKDGCMWAVRPLMCALFLCETAEKTILHTNGTLEKQWAAYREKQREFRWPDRVVLFDTLEKEFRQFGVEVPLMYFHNSPGLLAVKRKAGLR